MVKSLLQTCLDFIQKPCKLENNIDLYWLNCGIRCIPFKFYNQLIANEFYYCTCKYRIYNIFKTGQTDNIYSMSVLPKNCFHCWFLFMIEIKIKLLFKYKDNIVRFTSLLDSFLKFINQYKYIYFSPNFQNIDYDYLNVYDLCLCCYSSESTPF